MGSFFFVLDKNPRLVVDFVRDKVLIHVEVDGVLYSRTVRVGEFSAGPMQRNSVQRTDNSGLRPTGRSEGSDHGSATEPASLGHGKDQNPSQSVGKPTYQTCVW